MITSKFIRRAAALIVAPALILGAAGTAGAATDTDPRFRDYPTIRSATVDVISYDTGKGRIVCWENVSGKYEFTCQNSSRVWKNSKGKTGNTLQFDFDNRKVLTASGNYNSGNSVEKELVEGTKYAYEGIVVQGKGGKLYFSSPDHGTRGWVSPSGWKILKAD